MAFCCLLFGLAQQFALEPLFTTMVLGMTVANLFPAATPFEHLHIDEDRRGTKMNLTSERYISTNNKQVPLK